MREELYHLVDLLPEAELRPAPGLIRAHAAGEHGPERDLPSFAWFEADPDLAERAEEILAWSGTSSSRGWDRRLR